MIDKGVLTIRKPYTHTQREVNENNSREKRNRVGVEIHKWRFYQKSSNDMNELKDGEVQTHIGTSVYILMKVVWVMKKYLKNLL